MRRNPKYAESWRDTLRTFGTRARRDAFIRWYMDAGIEYDVAMRQFFGVDVKAA